MNYYSSSRQSPPVNLARAVFNGLAPDGGLYMPEDVRRLPDAFFRNISEMSLQEIAFVVLNALFGDEIDSRSLKKITDEALSFDIPLRPIDDGIYALELFHGPTYAFKDVGARLLARILSRLNDNPGSTVNVLVATSGDSGGAVANGFFRVPGINVFVLYPAGKISREQEAQFAALGENIHAIEVHGTFDDCQTIVRNAFADKDLCSKVKLTSANSLNPIRLLPQTIYYFYAFAQILKNSSTDPNEIIFSVPCGNLGNLCSGLFAERMGLPVKRFVAANNANNVFHDFLDSGIYTPRTSVLTKASAMDVGAPSNFARIIDLFDRQHSKIAARISGYSFSDRQILDVIRDTYLKHGYLLDPHGATAYMALREALRKGESGIFLETAHPAKFRDTVEEAIGQPIDVPEKLQISNEPRHKESIAPTYSAFRRYFLRKSN